MRTPAPPPRPAEDGLLRCKQLTVLLDWAEQFEAESRQSDEAVDGVAGNRVPNEIPYIVWPVSPVPCSKS